MTIDEAIAHVREVAYKNSSCWEHCNYTANDCDICQEENKQLAEWLEELKMYRESSYGELYDMVYNKAIYDFAKMISEYLGVQNCTKYGNQNKEQQRNSYDTLMKYEIANAIDDVAEQLKAGVNNEISGR